MFGVTAYFLRKNKKYFKVFLFSLLWLFAFSLFVSLAIPSTNEVLVRDYDWNLMRYRYFAFIGTSVMLAVLALSINEVLNKKFNIQKAKIIFSLIIFLFMAMNLLLIWKIEGDIYAVAYKPQKEFYVAFKNYFPSLPKNTVFYIYPNASGLGDYLLEWYLIKEGSYPNLVGEPFRVESQIIAVMDKIKKGEIKLSDVFFLDYDKNKGLLNKTKEVNKVILDQKHYLVNLQKTKNNLFESDAMQGSNTEFPYDLKFSLSSSPKDQFVGSSPDSVRFRALVDYNIEKRNYLDTALISTAITASQRPGEPFFHTLSSHLVDGNVGPRSRWIADSWSPWVEADLGREKEVIGIAWGSQIGVRSPATYAIFASKDGKKWEKVKAVKNFSKSETIDVFDKPVQARFVRMEIYTTAGGDFVLLDEFEVLNSNEEKILKFYKDRDELFNDANNMYKFVSGNDDLSYAKQRGLNYYWGKLTWETNKTSSVDNYQYWYFPYKIDEKNQNISIEIPEAEFFAGPGEFLKKYITSITLDFGGISSIMDVNSLRLVPREKIK